MPFRSVLFGDLGAATGVDEQSEPECLRDLNLDQIIDAVTSGRDDYNLKPFFYTPLDDVDSIVRRQEVFQDIERPDVHDILVSFADRKLVAHFTAQVRSMDDDDHGYGHYHRARRFLNAIEDYCASVSRLASGLTETGVRSRGLLGMRDYLARYVCSEPFVALASEVDELERALDDVRYCVLTRRDRITVGHYDGELDYSAEVATTFERFRQGDVLARQERFSDWADFAALGVLDLVAKLHPSLFEALDSFCVRHQAYLDHTIRVFDREVQFYLSYLDYIRALRDAGLTLDYPQMSSTEKHEQVADTFDLALAIQLTRQDGQVVCNDIFLNGRERILVVSGPNNGGKTTLARAFGQLHYLARLGCPVPGRDIHLFLCDQIYTHFERAESLTTLAGKLQDELNRLKADFDHATSSSVIILNEMFNSTTVHDSLFLSREILGKVTELGALCVCVTFLDELATLNSSTVSMVGTVDSDDPAIRTHRIVRKPADGNAYAHAIAEKYGLTYDRLVRRNSR